jgi:hypothetical protein
VGAPVLKVRLLSQLGACNHCLVTSSATLHGVAVDVRRLWVGVRRLKFQGSSPMPPDVGRYPEGETNPARRSMAVISSAVAGMRGAAA